MAMEFFVLSDRRLASIAEWQQAITAEGFQLLLSTETPFEAVNGFLPVRLGEKPADVECTKALDVFASALGEQQAGFECSHCDPLDLINRHPEVDFGRRWSRVLRFRWDGHVVDRSTIVGYVNLYFSAPIQLTWFPLLDNEFPSFPSEANLAVTAPSTFVRDPSLCRQAGCPLVFKFTIKRVAP